MSRFGAFPRSTALRCRSSGASCLGEGRNPSPSFASSRQGSTNRLAQPPSSFSYPRFVVSLSLLDFVLQDYVGAHPLVMDAHSGNVRGGIHAHLTHPPVRVCAKPRSQEREGCERGSLKKLKTKQYLQPHHQAHLFLLLRQNLQECLNLVIFFHPHN